MQFGWVDLGCSTTIEGFHMGEVIHVISSGGLYGAERTILGLIQSVKSHNHRVYCFSKPDGSQQSFVDALESQGTPVAILPDGYGDLRKNARRLAAHAGPNETLNLHAHGYKGTMTCAYVKRLSANVRVVCTQHGFTNKSFKTRTFTKLETRLIKSRAVDHVLCASNKIRDFYINSGVSSSKLTYIANSVDIPDRDRLGLDPETRKIDLLYLGRFSPEKGPDILIEALSILKSRNVTCRTVMAGDGALLSDMRSSAAERALSGQIDFPGFVSEPLKLLQNAKWLVMPSRTEGLPMSALEAMSLGTPLIATTVGELPSLIGNNIGGKLVEPDDAQQLADVLEQALNTTTPRWKEIAIAAHETVATRYALDRYGREIADIYDRVFENSPPLNHKSEAYVADL